MRHAVVVVGMQLAHLHMQQSSMDCRLASDLLQPSAEAVPSSKTAPCQTDVQRERAVAEGGAS